MAYYQTCTVCDGTGKLTCSRCGGSGKVFGNLHRFTQYTCSQVKALAPLEPVGNVTVWAVLKSKMMMIEYLNMLLKVTPH